MITLKDIAKEAGVSAMTVSNVINKNHSKVSQRNIEIITELVKKYNYTPSLTARSLVGKSSRIIGLIIPNAADDDFLSNPHNSLIISSIEASVRRKGYYLMVHSVNVPTDIIQLLQNWNVDGAILFGLFDDVLEQIVGKCKTPMVFVDSYSKNKNIVNVGTNDYKGGYLATKYLISNGHKKIAFLGTLNDHDGDDVINCRLNGYKSAIKEYNLPFLEEYLISLNSEYHDGIRIGEFISSMENRPTAAMVCSDIAAIGVIEGLRLSGLTVPNEFSIIGFDDLECCCYASPKLTSIHQDISAKGTLGVELLFDRINNFNLDGKAIVLDVKISERNSVRKL